jgi:tetratricopeptide (TPR) repeat protein
MDAEPHLTRPLLLRFFGASASVEERRRIVRHLMTRCEPCRELAEKVWLETGGLGLVRRTEHEARDLRFSIPHLAALEARKRREDAAAPALWDQIRDLPPGRRSLMLQTQEFQTLGLVEHILGESSRTAPGEPKKAIELAQVALELLDALLPKAYGECLLADYRARACGTLANARRIAGDFVGARDMLEAGFDLLLDGTGDPLEEARLLSLKASLEIEIGEFEAAIRTLEKAASIYASVSDSHLLGRTRIKQARALVELQPEAALPRAAEGLSLIDPSDARTHLSGVHTTIMALNALGRPYEAFMKLQQHQFLYQKFSDDKTQLQLRVMQARIAGKLDLFDEAREIYLDVAQAFEERGDHQEMVLARIEFLQLLVAKGMREPALEIARSAMPVLERLGLRNDLLSMWGFLFHALEEDLVRAEILRRAREYFVRYWYAPPANPSKWP